VKKKNGLKTGSPVNESKRQTMKEKPVKKIPFPRKAEKKEGEKQSKKM
jgi:hypothetical protein